MLESCDSFVDGSFDLDSVHSFDDFAIEPTIHADSLSIVANNSATDCEGGILVQCYR
jgi:hypothetical protein